MANNTRSQDRIHKRGTIFVWGIVFSLLLTACSADQKTYTIGVINIVPDLDDTLEGFKEGMAELGYVEGENHLGMDVSHGCVRVGYDEAPILYDMVEVGTPIIIHY